MLRYFWKLLVTLSYSTLKCFPAQFILAFCFNGWPGWQGYTRETVEHSVLLAKSWHLAFNLSSNYTKLFGEIQSSVLAKFIRCHIFTNVTNRFKDFNRQFCSQVFKGFFEFWYNTNVPHFLATFSHHNENISKQLFPTCLAIA